MRPFRQSGITVRAHAQRRRCRSALSVRSLAHLLSICGMYTASDSTRRSRYTTRRFSTCANILAYCSRHTDRERRDLRGVNSATLSVWLGHKIPTPTPACQAGIEALLPILLWYDPAGTRTHDILRERRTRLPIWQ